MTQLAETDLITVNDVPYEVRELPATLDSIRAAELTGSLVIAQQVYMDGSPYRVSEQTKERGDMLEAEWADYRRRFRIAHREGKPAPEVEFRPYIGTVETLGHTATYFGMKQIETSTKAILPLHIVKDTKGNNVHKLRLMQVL